MTASSMLVDPVSVCSPVSVSPVAAVTATDKFEGGGMKGFSRRSQFSWSPRLLTVGTRDGIGTLHLVLEYQGEEIEGALRIRAL
jgi:hypothetical protein